MLVEEKDIIFTGTGSAAALLDQDVTEAYHVTDVAADKMDGVKRWSQLNLTIPNDPHFDAAMEHVPLTFLTISRVVLRGKRQLPTVSTYPRNGTHEADYVRIRIPLKNFDDYHMWYSHYVESVTGSVTQHFFVLSKTKGKFDTMLTPVTEGIPHVHQDHTLLLRTAAKTWHAKDYVVKGGRNHIINLAVDEPVQNSKRNWTYDTVQLRKPGTGTDRLVAPSTTVKSVVAFIECVVKREYKQRLLAAYETSVNAMKAQAQKSAMEQLLKLARENDDIVFKAAKECERLRGEKRYVTGWKHAIDAFLTDVALVGPQNLFGPLCLQLLHGLQAHQVIEMVARCIDVMLAQEEKKE